MRYISIEVCKKESQLGTVTLEIEPTCGVTEITNVQQVIQGCVMVFGANGENIETNNGNETPHTGPGLVGVHKGSVYITMGSPDTICHLNKFGKIVGRVIFGESVLRSLEAANTAKDLTVISSSILNEETAAMLPEGDGFQDLTEDEMASKGDALRGEGNNRYKAKEYTEALKQYKTALQYGGNDVNRRIKIYTNMSACYKGMDMWPEARKYAREAWKLDPKNAKSAYKYAEALSHLQRDLDVAKSVLRDVDTNDPSVRKLYNSLLAASKQKTKKLSLAMNKWVSTEAPPPSFKDRLTGRAIAFTIANNSIAYSVDGTPRKACSKIVLRADKTIYFPETNKQVAPPIEFFPPEGLLEHCSREGIEVSTQN
eukprot:TRINITY_DN20558_c0_g1_i1.p1 TRINITY_DN20558_c0_g1~~TRINITY_DN20558_c0_g1_i1.p1  ORF type:complete len:370 (+),score=52.73 TRINITY_DN20558_c0_g1_i1:47-1156(+)